MSGDFSVNQVLVYKVMKNNIKWSCEKAMEQGSEQASLGGRAGRNMARHSWS